MPIPDLEISVTGDVADGISGLKQVQQELSSIFNLTEKLRVLQSSVFTEKDRGKIASYNKEIAATQAQIAKLSTLGTGGALGNLSSQFSGLAAGAGKAFGVVRQLAYILPGVGIAGLAAFAIDPIANYITALFGVTEAEKKLNEERTKKVKEYKDLVDGIVKSVAKEAGEVVSLIAVLRSETETRQRKLEAIKELKKIQPEIFAGLKLEGEAVVGLDNAYKNYIANLRNVVAAKLIQAQIDAKITKLLTLQGAAQTTSQQKLSDGLRKYVDSLQAAKDKQDAIFGRINAGPRKLNVFEQQDSDVNALNADIEDLVNQLSEFSKGIDTKAFKESVKDVRTIADVLADMNNQIRFLSEKEILLNTNEAKGKLAALEGALDELVKKFKLGTDNPIVVNLAFRINQANAQTATDELLARTKILDAGEKVYEKRILIKPKFGIVESEAQKGLREAAQRIEALAEQFAVQVSNTVSNIMGETAIVTGDAIANLFAGNGDAVSNIFGNLMSSVGQQIQALGKFLIQSGIQIKIAKDAFSKLLANPIASIAVGVGLVLLGALIKSQASKQYKGFAGGVRNFQPNGEVVNVGERGMETIFLPRGSTVQPHNEVKAYGGGQQVFIPEMRLSGTDIVIAYNRASAQMGRNN